MKITKLSTVFVCVTFLHNLNFKVLGSMLLSTYNFADPDPACHFAVEPDLPFTLMRIRILIQPITLMRIRILPFNLMRIHANPDP
jgi:hypothetical protein